MDFKIFLIAQKREEKMELSSRTKRVISVLAILLNVIFLGSLIYMVIQTPPKRFEWMIPAGIGVFIIINLTALILGTAKNKQENQNTTPGPRGSSKIRLAVIIAALLVFAGSGFWAGFSSKDKIERWKWTHKQNIKMAKFMDKKAPDVTGTTLKGKEWKLREQNGKVILLEFWATWCGPCTSSIPQMKQLYEKYKFHKDFVMVGVSLDDNKDKLTEFCKNQDLPWLMLFEEGKGWNNSMARAFEISGIPSCWIIDKQGNVAGMDIHSGRHEEIEKIIEKSMEGSEAVSN
jgi:peroxiredoxin